MYRHFGKRFFDFVVALGCLLLLVIPMALIAALIWFRAGRPILFRQPRVGKGGEIFSIMKFRTMVHSVAENSPITTAGDKRITPVGRFLRKWKLDELPQLWNVLVGDMSLVGPRPDVPGYADRLQGEERKLLLLRPGITGPATLRYRHEEELLAQVSDPLQHNDEVLYPDKVRINLQYLQQCSFRIDLYYLFKTFLTLLRRRPELPNSTVR